MSVWNILTVIPTTTAPYVYDAESLAYRPGMMMQMVKDWGDRGIDITIVLHQKQDSPLLPWSAAK